jgi:outer membrane protein assembly factor BamE (lipoprotein component of BamABCDE complex)
MRIAPWVAVLAVVAAGCASYGGASLNPGTSSEAQVRGLMGPPALEMRDPDGTRHLYYPRGPLGSQTYVADLAPSGVLKEMRQVLTDGVFNAIRAGWTEEEVLRLIGPPREKAYFSNLKQTAWDYKFRDSWGYESILSVMIDTNGVVVSKFARRIERFERGM